jgi:hypothetical protein
MSLFRVKLLFTIDKWNAFRKPTLRMKRLGESEDREVSLGQIPIAPKLAKFGIDSPMNFVSPSCNSSPLLLLWYYYVTKQNDTFVAEERYLRGCSFIPVQLE